MEEKKTDLNDQALDDKKLNDVSGGGFSGNSLYKCSNSSCGFTSHTKMSKCPNCSYPVDKLVIRKHFH